MTERTGLHRFKRLKGRFDLNGKKKNEGEMSAFHPCPKRLWLTIRIYSSPVFAHITNQSIDRSVILLCGWAISFLVWFQQVWKQYTMRCKLRLSLISITIVHFHLFLKSQIQSGSSSAQGKIKRVFIQVSHLVHIMVPCAARLLVATLSAPTDILEWRQGAALADQASVYESKCLLVMFPTSLLFYL